MWDLQKEPAPMKDLCAAGQGMPGLVKRFVEMGVVGLPGLIGEGVELNAQGSEIAGVQFCHHDNSRMLVRTIHPLAALPIVLVRAALIKMLVHKQKPRRFRRGSVSGGS
jgi:hypothetical protein